MKTTLVKTLAASALIAATSLPAAALAAPGTGQGAGPSADRGAGPGAKVAQCTNADLDASFRARDAGAGHRYGVLRLTNTSGTACRTGGYGGLSYVGGGNGTQVGAAADRDGGTVRSIVLQPGQRVRSRVDETVAQNYPKGRCQPTHVEGFRVYVPNSTKAQFVKHPTTGCAKAGVHLISHRAYVRG